MTDEHDRHLVFWPKALLSEDGRKQSSRGEAKVHLCVGKDRQMSIDLSNW